MSPLRRFLDLASIRRLASGRDARQRNCERIASRCIDELRVSGIAAANLVEYGYPLFPAPLWRTVEPRPCDGSSPGRHRAPHPL